MEGKFKSELNTDYIFDQISDNIFNNYSINIKLDDKYKSIFDNNINIVFNNNRNVPLDRLNDILMESTIELIKNNLTDKKEDKRITTNINDAYEQYTLNRNNDNTNFNNNSDNNSNNNFNEVDFGSTPLNNFNEVDIGSTPLNNFNEVDFGSTPLNNFNEEKTGVKTFNDNKIKNKDSIKNDNILKLSSFDRVNYNSSRYNYKINTKLNNKKLHRMIIPIEDNYIFSSPILYLKINEKNIMLKLDDIIDNNERKYGTYYPIDNDIKFNNINNININITDISETIHNTIDILNINKVIINNEYIVLYNKFIITECSVNDYIKLTECEKNLIDMNSILNIPLKINNIDGNKIIIKKTINTKNISLDIDMKFINISNQNFIFFK
jgi:hypothetical protein